MRSFILVAGLSVAIHAAFAQSYSQRLRDANAHLQAGEPEEALTLYTDLKIDDPESDLIAHNMGLAKMRYADELRERGATGDAIQSLEEAAGHFEHAMDLGNEEVIESAEFAKANASFKSAEAHKDQSAFQNALEGYKQAISEYENVLRHDPTHAGARQNRNLAKLRLKELMRDTPPEQQQQEQEQSGEGQDDNKQDFQSQNEQEKGEQGEGDAGAGGESTEQDRQQNDAPGDGMDENQQQQGEEGNNSAEPEDGSRQPDLDEFREANDTQDTGKQSQSQPQDEPSDSPAPPSQQSIEALLQSLEQMDNRLQHDARRSHERSPRIRSWW